MCHYLYVGSLPSKNYILPLVIFFLWLSKDTFEEAMLFNIYVKLPGRIICRFGDTVVVINVTFYLHSDTDLYVSCICLLMRIPWSPFDCYWSLFHFPGFSTLWFVVLQVVNFRLVWDRIGSKRFIGFYEGEWIHWRYWFAIKLLLAVCIFLQSEL